LLRPISIWKIAKKLLNKAMNTLQQFIYRTRIRAPLDKVAEFHRDSRALKKLTPPPIYVTFKEIQPLGEQSISDFTMWFGPLPVRWVAVHSDVDPRHGFTDHQKQGPFAYWKHRHSFEFVDEQTTDIVDEIQAQAGKGLVNGLLSRFMWWSTPFLFAYRARVMRHELEGGHA
jgi:ligand-binding SRPBCC domain-containing protein